MWREPSAHNTKRTRLCAQADQTLAKMAPHIQYNGVAPALLPPMRHRLGSRGAEHCAFHRFCARRAVVAALRFAAASCSAGSHPALFGHLFGQAAEVAGQIPVLCIKSVPATKPSPGENPERSEINSGRSYRELVKEGSTHTQTITTRFLGRPSIPAPLSPARSFAGLTSHALGTFGMRRKSERGEHSSLLTTTVCS